jgi:hypothetical protein
MPWGEQSIGCSPLLHLIIQAFLPMPLKTQYDQRAKRFLFKQTPSKTMSLYPSFNESTLTNAKQNILLNKGGHFMQPPTGRHLSA